MMTENKRFKIDLDEEAITDNGEFCLSLYCFQDKGEKDVCNLLNELAEENEQLKADNNRLVNETARIVAEHQGRVLDLIDEKIKENKRDYKMTYEDELKGRIEVLEELKKELEND